MQNMAENIKFAIPVGRVRKYPGRLLVSGQLLAGLRRDGATWSQDGRWDRRPQGRVDDRLQA
jgi:hypothetical protein